MKKRGICARWRSGKMRSNRFVLRAAALLCALLALLSLTGCAAKKQEKYSMQFFGAFDTVIQIMGYAGSEAEFTAAAEKAQAEFVRLHEIFDRYNEYEGVNNLRRVNERAGRAPVQAEPELIELLLFCRERQREYPGRVNVAMGAVFDLWHEYCEAGAAIPPMDALTAAAAHCDMDDVILDETAGTVYFADPELKLDVGAVAKGWAAERAAKVLEESGLASYLINAGGNVRAGGAPKDGRLYWGVSVQDPDDAQGGLDVLYFTNGSAVTSGDYQRYYEVNGRRYHHIIDPETLMPSEYLRAVTVWTEDSALADFLSTTLFLTPYEDGRALVDSLAGVEALWVLPDGTVSMTDGMRAMARSGGASATESH